MYEAIMRAVTTVLVTAIGGMSQSALDRAGLVMVAFVGISLVAGVVLVILKD